MYSHECHGELPREGPIVQGLGEDRARFRLLHKSDLAAKWSAIPAEQLAVELPDTPWGRSYLHRAAQELQRLQGTPAQHGYPGIMLVSMANFREPEDPRQQAGTRRSMEPQLRKAFIRRHRSCLTIAIAIAIVCYAIHKHSRKEQTQ